MRANLNVIYCWFGRHVWKSDIEKTNGWWWRFCDECGQRQKGEDSIIWMNW